MYSSHTGHQTFVSILDLTNQKHVIAQYVVSLIKDAHKSGLQIIDVGAGNGIIAKEIIQVAGDLIKRYCMIEPSKFLFEEAQKRTQQYNQVYSLQELAQNVDFGSSNYIFFSFSIHLIPNAIDVIHRAFLSLTPGGKIIIFVQSKGNLDTLLRTRLGIPVFDYADFIDCATQGYAKQINQHESLLFGKQEMINLTQSGKKILSSWLGKSEHEWTQEHIESCKDIFTQFSQGDNLIRTFESITIQK